MSLHDLHIIKNISCIFTFGKTPLSGTDNINGLQASDLLGYPISRYVIDQKENRAFEKIKSKIVQDKNGNFKGFGIKIFP